MSFPDYTTAIGTEISKALHGEREYGPDVMQLMYVANRYERRPEMAAWLEEGTVLVCDRYLASSIAYGEAQGLDAGVAARHSALPERSRPDDPARYRAGNRRAAQSPAGAIAMSAICGLLSRVRESYRRQATQAGWLTLNGERTARRGLARRPQRDRDTTRAAVSARTSRAPAASSTRAHASTVAPVVLTSSINTITEPCTLTPLRIANALCTFAWRASAGRSVCDVVAADPLQRVDHRDRQMPGDLRCLIETALTFLRPMKWNRYRRIGACQQAGAGTGQQMCQRARQRSMTGIFQRVDDLAKGAVVLANGGALRHDAIAATAAWTPTDIRTDAAPRRQGIAAARRREGV